MSFSTSEVEDLLDRSGIKKSPPTITYWQGLLSDLSAGQVERIVTTQSRRSVFRHSRIARDPSYRVIIKKDNAKRTNRSSEYKARNAVRERSFSSVFVAIDTEGANLGPEFGRDVALPMDSRNPNAKRDKRIFQNQRFFLIGASDGKKNFWLKAEKDSFLKGIEILEWLTEVAKKFPKGTIFVGFGLSYDFTQILRDMPYSKKAALQLGITESEVNDRIKEGCPHDLKPQKKRCLEKSGALERDFGRVCSKV